MNNKKFGRILLSSSTGKKIFGGGKSTGLYSLSKYMNAVSFLIYYKEFYQQQQLYIINKYT